MGTTAVSSSHSGDGKGQQWFLYSAGCQLYEHFCNGLAQMETASSSAGGRYSAVISLYSARTGAINRQTSVTAVAHAAAAVAAPGVPCEARNQWRQLVLFVKSLFRFARASINTNSCLATALLVGLCTLRRVADLPRFRAP